MLDPTLELKIGAKRRVVPNEFNKNKLKNLLVRVGLFGVAKIKNLFLIRSWNCVMRRLKVFNNLFLCFWFC